MSKAAQLAQDFTGKQYLADEDLKGLPTNVQAAVRSVQAASASINRRVGAAHRLFARDPKHPFALDPEKQEQSTAVYQYEDVGGEIVEVRKDSHLGHVQIIHRPDLVAASEPDAASEIEDEIRRLAEEQ